MNRLIIFLLAAVDALVSVAVGIALIIAPLTVLWVFALPGADWGALWPTTATLWQFAMLVPLQIELPLEYVAALGIEADAAAFTLSLAPLGFAAFMIIFAARSGMRASQAEAWITGVVTSTVVVASVAALIALSSTTPVVQVELWQAILFPTLLFAVPALVAAVVMEWRNAGGGPIAALRARFEHEGADWAVVPTLIGRGAAIVVVGLIGAGALLSAVALAFSAGDMVALYQASNVDALGAVMLTLGQGAYLPTVFVWAIAFIAGPGFALGTGSIVAPAGTTAGIVPGIPLLAIVPSDGNGWLLLLALIPVALGAFAGWVARSYLLRSRETSRGHEAMAPRLAVLGGITVLSASAAAILAALASGAFGPGRLAEFGPQPGPIALAIGVEVAIGAAILLLSPHPGEEPAAPAEEHLTAPLD